MSEKIKAFICFLILYAMFIVPTAAFAADGWNLNISKGYSERHAGTNFAWNLWAKDENGNVDFKGNPVRSGLPGTQAIFDRGCVAEIFVDILNAGENLKKIAEELNLQSAIPYNAERGSYLIDTDKIPSGVNRFKTISTHMGGLARTQLVIITLSNNYPITDEDVYYFIVQDTKSSITSRQYEALINSSGGIAICGVDVNRNLKPRIVDSNTPGQQITSEEAENLPKGIINFRLWTNSEKKIVSNVPVRLAVWVTTKENRKVRLPGSNEYSDYFVMTDGQMQSVPAGAVELKVDQNGRQFEIVTIGNEFEMWKNGQINSITRNVEPGQTITIDLIVK